MLFSVPRNVVPGDVVPSDAVPGDSKLARQLIEDGVKVWGGYVKLAKIEPLS